MAKGKVVKERLKYKGFKLISLQMWNDYLFGSIKYDFIDDEIVQNQIYTTVIIGQNGTLKSRLFEKIIRIFWNLYELKNNVEKAFIDTPMSFEIRYSFNGSVYDFSNKGKLPNPKPGVMAFEMFMPELKINGKLQDGFEKAEFPASIIANAIMITDRFPFPDPKRFDIYHYLGSRFRPQLASTKTFIGRVVEFVSKNINSKSFIDGVRKIAKEFLHESNDPCITFHTSNTHRFFKGNMNVKEFYSYFEEMDLRYKEKKTAPPFKLNHYKSKIKKDKELSEKILQYCNRLKEGRQLRIPGGRSVKAITFNLLSEKDVKRLGSEFELLNHMRQLGIIYPAEIEFLRIVHDDKDPNIQGYSIVESSSGEHNLFGSMIGLIASITPHSLIFIDEPEISLHPNWQMRYLSFLRELLSDEVYATCHIIVATHSHFLISDLDGQHSSVVTLNRDPKTNRLSAELLQGQNTFGWSPDDILYNVFGVISSRNKFVAEDIAKILDTLSKGNKNGVNKIDPKTYNTLVHLRQTLKDSDPLKEVVKSILKKVN
jgi:hypothetical protein